MKQDPSIFTTWLRWSQSDRWYLIPATVFAWGLGLLLLSYMAGNFWLVRRANAELGIVLQIDGKEAGYLKTDGHGKGSALPPFGTTGSLQNMDSANVASTKPTRPNESSEPARHFLVGYFLHPNWSIWNALLVPACVWLVMRLYRSTRTIATSLVRRNVVGVVGRDQSSSELQLRAYLDETKPWMEVAFVVLAVLIIVIHAWNDGADFRTNLGFGQPHLYPLAYLFVNQSVPPSGLMNVFLVVAYAGTYITIMILSHFLVWSISMFIRVSKLVPPLMEGTPLAVQEVRVVVDGQPVAFTVQLQYEDSGKQFGVGSLAELFDNVHWIAAICLLLYPLIQASNMWRERVDVLQPTAVNSFTISIVGSLLLFLIPITCASERIKRYKSALLNHFQGNKEKTEQVLQNKIWPAGSVPVVALACSVLTSLELMGCEYLYHDNAPLALNRWVCTAGVSWLGWMMITPLWPYIEKIVPWLKPNK